MPTLHLYRACFNKLLFSKNKRLTNYNGECPLDPTSTVLEPYSSNDETLMEHISSHTFLITMLIISVTGNSAVQALDNLLPSIQALPVRGLPHATSSFPHPRPIRSMSSTCGSAWTRQVPPLSDFGQRQVLPLAIG